MNKNPDYDSLVNWHHDRDPKRHIVDVWDRQFLYQVSIVFVVAVDTTLNSC
jgi:hypothetical protein